MAGALSWISWKRCVGQKCGRGTGLVYLVCGMHILLLHAHKINESNVLYVKIFICNDVLNENLYIYHLHLIFAFYVL